MPTTTYRWAKVALPDPSTYYGGFKEARVLSYGDINRSLSDDRGNYEGADFSFEVSDYDRLIRGLMSGSSTKYGSVNRNLTIRMISDRDRRLQLTPRTIARGVTKQIVPLSGLGARFEAIDFVTSKFAGTNTKKQIPQRLWGVDFPSAPIDTRKLAAPIIYGEVSDEASATPPPIPDTLTAEGSYVWGGYYTAGYGPLTSTAGVPTNIVLGVSAGGTLDVDVPNSEYGVWVTAVDAAGAETDPHIFYPGGPGDGRGSFAFGPIPAVSVDGTQKIDVSWTASANAVKYRVYLAWWYYGARWQQYIEVSAPTVTCSFTAGPNWSTPATASNITPGASLPHFSQFWYYAILALMADGLTAVSQTIFGSSGPYRRPIRLRWLAVVGATEYRIVRRGAGGGDGGDGEGGGDGDGWTRQWTVPSAQLYFDDDLLDTGVTYLADGLATPKGAVPTMYLGETKDDANFVWATFGICGHAVKEVNSWFLGGQRVDTGTAGVDWLIPGQAGYLSYFATSGVAGRYRDVNGRRYALIYVRGPSAEEATAGGKAITVNMKGVEDVGDGTGSLIEKIILQYKHFVINFGFQDYQSGVWLTAPTWAPDDPSVSQIDETSFATAVTTAEGRIGGGYLGAGIIGNNGEQQPLREWMARFNLSSNTDSGFNRNNQFFVVMLNDHFSVLASALVFTQLRDIIASTFTLVPQRDRHFNVCPYSYRYKWRSAAWDVQEASVRDATSIAGYLEELIAPTTELWFVRDATTANDVMMRRLLLSKDPPLLVQFQTSLVGFNTDLGDMILVTHTEGLSASGWTRNAVRIQRQALNPNDFSLRMECLDVQRIFASAFILGDDTWAVAWTAASTTQKQYGFLCDETTGLFSDGTPGKRLR